MPKRKPQKPYKGILRMPAPKYDANLSADENMARAKEDTVKKMVALFEHYGLDLNDPKKWQRLSFQLAFDHIGTIGPSWTRPGRKPRRDDAIRDLSLFFTLFKAELHGKSVKAKAQRITKPNSAIPQLRGQNPRSLRERFYKLKNPKSKEGKNMRELIASFTNEKYPEELRGHASHILSFLSDIEDSELK
jgi:hypothetical protein